MPKPPLRRYVLARQAHMSLNDVAGPRKFGESRTAIWKDTQAAPPRLDYAALCVYTTVNGITDYFAVVDNVQHRVHVERSATEISTTLRNGRPFRTVYTCFPLDRNLP